MDRGDNVCTILLVDDEEFIIKSLQRLLMDESYSILTSSSGGEALEILKQHDVSVIVSDQRMPEMTGSEFLSLSKKTHPDAIRILLTGFSDIGSTIEAINKGEIYKYITKPWDDDSLKFTIKEAVETFALRRENKRLTEELKEWNLKLEQRVKEQTIDIQKRNKALIVLNERLKKNFQSSLEAFASLIELRDPNISNHSKNVEGLSVLIAKQMELSQKETDTIAAAALLHDIGKIGIVDSILKKEFKEMNFEERKAMEQHPIRGQTSLAPVEDLREAGVLVRHHHEWVNGSGYPDRLKTDEIPLGSKIIAVADAVDRLANPGKQSDRCDFMKAFEIVLGGREIKYDAKVLDAARPVIKELSRNVYKMIGAEEDEIPPDKLLPGMILSRDLRSGTGVLIMPQTTILNDEKIAYLQRLFDMDPSKGGVFVTKENFE